ncbi:MAG: hypothetical protein AB3N20_20480 [Rhizobiaceae bacterium]
MKSLFKVVAAVAVLAPVQANAVTDNIPFNGTIADTCAITVGSSGTITPNAGYTQLSSNNAGGAPGTAVIMATGTGWEVDTVAPAAFSTEPVVTASTFAVTYDLSGATTASNVPGATQTALTNGSTSVSVDLTATHPTGSYQAGTYAATVVLRCE